MQGFYQYYIDLDDYEIKDMIGKGLSLVFRGIEKITGIEVAIQVLINSIRMEFRKEQRSFLFTVLSSLFNDIPGIVKIKGFRFPLTSEEIDIFKLKGKTIKKIATDKNGKKIDIDLTGAIIVYELMEITNLDKIVFNYLNSKGKENETINPTIRSKIAFGVAATMKKIEKMKIVFGDLKLEKIYLDNNFEPKIKLEPYIEYNFPEYDYDYCVGTPL